MLLLKMLLILIIITSNLRNDCLRLLNNQNMDEIIVYLVVIDLMLHAFCWDLLLSIVLHPFLLLLILTLYLE